ncbi:hypothetical protein ACLKMH_13545 [Psychromonas sp. KJ10-10]|uniref:hypothetical protein n=1 Tax=Psychromonas sp. KJ10-10 TaxID=3391823 RepID=UPI0039B4D7B9
MLSCSSKAEVNLIVNNMIDEDYSAFKKSGFSFEKNTDTSKSPVINFAKLSTKNLSNQPKQYNKQNNKKVLANIIAQEKQQAVLISLLSVAVLAVPV